MAVRELSSARTGSLQWLTAHRIVRFWHQQRAEKAEITQGTMSKRKEREGPLKLTDFFPPVTDRPIQDGADAGTCIPTAPANVLNHPAPSEGELPDSGIPLPSSPFISPAKKKRSLGEQGDVQHVTGLEGEEMEESNTCSQQLKEFSTTGQPILDTPMKEMLQTLRGALQHDMAAFMKSTKSQLAMVSNRMEYMEKKT